MTNTDVRLATVPGNEGRPAKGTNETDDFLKPKAVYWSTNHAIDDDVGTRNAAVRWCGDNGASSSENLNSHDNLSSGSCLTGDLPVNTAEKLQQAISCSSVPMDPLTRENLGFSKVDTYEDEVRLLSLYKGLLYLLPRPPTLKTVQQGPLNNQIAGGIYHIYESQGGESGYFSWFKKDQQVMDRDYANPNGPRAAPCSRSTMLDYAVWESGLGRHGLSELLLCLSEPCTKTCSPRIEGVRWCPKERISMNGREWNIQRYLQHRFTHMTPVTSSNINLPSSIRVT